jgi:hypothetical protein
MTARCLKGNTSLAKLTKKVKLVLDERNISQERLIGWKSFWPQKMFFWTFSHYKVDFKVNFKN